MCWASAFAGLLPCLFGAVSSAQTALPPEILLLARIKTKAAENLQRLPNYTCTETIERSRRARHSKTSSGSTRSGLEVALVGGKELFSWPGAGKFEEKGIGELVGSGAAIGNGAFALHAKSIFLSTWPTFTYVGERPLEGRSAIRYDYVVPQMVSRYQIRAGASQARVGYHGSFWVEPDTLDLIRLEVYADSLSTNLELRESSDALEYRQVRIGDVDFLLPQSSELRMIDLLGNESRNRTRLSECRQYTGESVVTFGDIPPPSVMAAPAPQMKPIHLPSGLRVEMRLQTPIQSGRSATGDPVKALLGRDLMSDGKKLRQKEQC